MALQQQLKTLGEYLSRFSILVLKETEGKVKLDGRRLGFIYRNLLAARSCEMARQDAFEEELPEGTQNVKRVILF